MQCQGEGSRRPLSLGSFHQVVGAGPSWAPAGGSHPGRVFLYLAPRSGRDHAGLRPDPYLLDFSPSFRLRASDAGLYALILGR